MEKKLETDILLKIDELVESIKSHSTYLTYLELADKLKLNKEINALIEEVKAYQKEAVKKEMLGELSEVKALDNDISSCLSKLNKYPLYLDYLDYQRELNTTFQLIKESLEDYLNKYTN
ncbi:MAG: YlbF family regulator [Bacilli bacterium]